MQDSTKDGPGGGDRRNWRERLGVGQDLPKISDEFKPSQTDSPPDQQAPDAKPAQAGPQPGAQNGPGPGSPVRPAPMAPRVARPTAPRPADDSDARGDLSASGEARLAPPPKPLSTPASTFKSAEAYRQQRPAGQGTWSTSQPQGSGAAGARSGFVSRTSPPAASQRPAVPSRGPAAQAHTGRSSATPPTIGSDSFGERLRAQREAAERLAQQRLAAARDRAGGAAGAKPMPDAPKVDAPPTETAPQREPSVQPADGEQPRFTFAREEIVAAQRESGPNQEGEPATADHQHQPSGPPPYTPPSAYARSEPPGDGEARPGEVSVQMAPGFVPHPAASEYRPGAGAGFHAGEEPGRQPDLGYVAPQADYRHEDDAMFEDERPGLYAAPPRASAADYSAAYREFEDEFDEEPRRRGGPVLLLLSLLAVAVISGGVIYWYQQLQPASAPATAEVPVIAAPEESAKADPEPVEPSQAAVMPTRRKQIYDRILGQETLEPERIVPTEEEPQLRQIQQQPRASEAGQSDSPRQQPARQEQSTEPLPLPLPPPPGTGEQGDLLVPGLANTETALSTPEPAQLVLPAPVAQAARPSQSAGERTSLESSPPSSQTSARSDSGDAAPVAQSIYPEPRSGLSYPEPDLSLPYAGPSSPPAPSEVAVESPVQDQAGELDAAPVAALPEPEREPEPQAEPEVEPGSAAPLPRAKPEVPAGVRTVTRSAPRPEPQQSQRQRTAPAQSSGSGPVQITPTLLAPQGAQQVQQPQVQQPQIQQPATAPSPTRSIGREADPLEGHRSPFSGSPVSESGPAARQLSSSQEPPTPPAARPQPQQQQVASVAPEAVRSQSESAGGYVVQLASFRSESEALNEYQQLVQRHPQLVGGLKSRVQEASLGQSGTFYRLGVGPVADRNAATKLCNDLISAGEKDCLVRRN